MNEINTPTDETSPYDQLGILLRENGDKLFSDLRLRKVAYILYNKGKDNADGDSINEVITDIKNILSGIITDKSVISAIFEKDQIAQDEANVRGIIQSL